MADKTTTRIGGEGHDRAVFRAVPNQSGDTQLPAGVGAPPGDPAAGTSQARARTAANAPAPDPHRINHTSLIDWALSNEQNLIQRVSWTD